MTNISFLFHSRMDEFQKLISYPDVENLDIVKVHHALGQIIVDQTVAKLFRSDARKLQAVLRNLCRSESKPSMMMVLLAIASFSFGRKVSDKIIFYSSRKDFYKPIRNSNFYTVNDLADEMDIVTFNDEPTCFSPKIRALAKRKRITLPNLKS